MKIWLDDERREPEGFIRTKTAEETIEFLKLGEVTYIGFDHDLGTKMTGHDVALWIEKEAANNEDFRVPAFAIQSANKVGTANIEATMKSARKICKNPHDELPWWELVRHGAVRL